jgi:UDP-glucose 4-epimerase
MLLLPQTSRILVTGGCGFVGYHLVRRLLRRSHEITVLDDLSTGSERHLPDSSSVRFVKGSVLDRGAVHEAARDAGFVFHLASLVGMRCVTDDQALSYATSREGTARVLEATGATPAVLFSSSSIYGLDGASFATEKQGVTWDGVLAYDGGTPGYAAGKWELEKMGRAAANAGRPVLIVRPFNLIGREQSAAYGMVVPRMLAAADAGASLVVYGDGHQTRCFCDVETFVECLFRLTSEPTTWELPDSAVNVGVPEPVSILALARLVCQVTGSNSPIRFVPYDEVYPGRRDVRERIPDTRILHTLIGGVRWPPLASVIRSLAKAG